MVDPNRKINRLNEKDIEFLDECEEEFAYRFTDEDEEFVKYCKQPVPPPPVLPNWRENRPNSNNSYGGNNRRWNQNHHKRGGHQNYRQHNNRGSYQRRDKF